MLMIVSLSHVVVKCRAEHTLLFAIEAGTPQNISSYATSRVQTRAYFTVRGQGRNTTRQCAPTYAQSFAKASGAESAMFGTAPPILRLLPPANKAESMNE